MVERRFEALRVAGSSPALAIFYSLVGQLERPRRFERRIVWVRIPSSGLIPAIVQRIALRFAKAPVWVQLLVVGLDKSDYLYYIQSHE